MPTKKLTARTRLVLQACLKVAGTKGTATIPEVIQELKPVMNPMSVRDYMAELQAAGLLTVYGTPLPGGLSHGSDYRMACASLPDTPPPAPRSEPVAYRTQRAAAAAAMAEGKPTAAVMRRPDSRFVVGSRRAGEKKGYKFIGRAKNMM